MASVEQLMEPTNEIKLSSWGMQIARIPEIKTKRFLMRQNRSLYMFTVEGAIANSEWDYVNNIRLRGHTIRSC